jgi:hypothetical protein
MSLFPPHSLILTANVHCSPPFPQPNNTNNAFSWLDLGATWNFATQNNSLSGGSDDAMIDPGLSPYDMSMLPDYSFLEGDNSNFIF